MTLCIQIDIGVQPSSAASCTPDSGTVGGAHSHSLQPLSSSHLPIGDRSLILCGHPLTGVGRFPNLAGGPAGPATRDLPLLPTCITVHRCSPAELPDVCRVECVIPAPRTAPSRPSLRIREPPARLFRSPDGCRCELPGPARLTIPHGRPRSQPVSSERTQLVELRALGSTGSSAEGALGDGPEPDELADFGSAVIPGRRTSRPKGLFVADGGSQCPEGLCSAAGFATSCWEALCSSVRRSRPRLSFLFPRVPFCSLEASVAMAGRWDAALMEQHSRTSATCGTGRGDRI